MTKTVVITPEVGEVIDDVQYRLRSDIGEIRIIF